jgi:hypothetical protein
MIKAFLGTRGIHPAACSLFTSILKEPFQEHALLKGILEMAPEPNPFPELARPTPTVPQIAGQNPTSPMAA